METKETTKRNTYGVTVGPLKPQYRLDLINIKTGEIDQTVITSATIDLELKNYNFGLRLNLAAGYDKPYTTVIRTNVSGALTGEIPQRAITNLFAEYRKVYNKYQDYFANVNYLELTKEARQRDDLRQEVLKQEEKYKKKLLRDELKRLAKENVDAQRPPIASLVPKPNVVVLDNTIEQEEN